jgi:RNA polymerase sigma-70 factor, ECF subfamily
MSEDGFAEFYAATARAVVRQVWALTGDLAEAQDVAQEAYARAWQRWPSVRRHPSPEAWVTLVARRLAVSRWRTARTAGRAWRRHGPPVDLPPADPDSVALVGALRRLPVEQRVALVLHHLADLPVEAVAAEVGAPVGTVKARLSRGRAALAHLLADQPDDDPLTERGGHR